MLFPGIAAAPGLAIAPCLKIRPVATGEGLKTISREQAAAELDRFKTAMAQASAQLESIAEAAKARGDQLRADIVEAQSMMLLRSRRRFWRRWKTTICGNAPVM